MKRNVPRFVFARCSNVTFLNKQIFQPFRDNFQSLGSLVLVLSRQYCEYHHMRLAEDVTPVNTPERAASQVSPLKRASSKGKLVKEKGQTQET